MKKLLTALSILLSLSCAVSAQGVPGQGAMVPNGVRPSITNIGFASLQTASNVTSYEVPGGFNTNQNTAAYSVVAGNFSNLYVRVITAPGAGNTATFTLYVGAPSAMSPTSVTCQISGATATTCSDNTDTAPVAAGQVWAIQTVTSTSATATGAKMLGIEFSAP